MCNDNLVYLNKVFSTEHAVGCPIMLDFETEDKSFVTKITYQDECNSCCKKAIIDKDANFIIKASQVIIRNLDLADPSSLNPDKITLDCLKVDGLELFNQRYMAGTSSIIDELTDCECLCKGLLSKAFFMIDCVGPWIADITIIASGVVYSCGECYNFKLISNSKDKFPLFLCQSSIFTIPGLGLPCRADNISPIINFKFTGSGNLICPCIKVKSQGECPSLSLKGKLIVDPVVNVEVTRQTLFQTNAKALDVPCDKLYDCMLDSNTCCDDDIPYPLQLSNNCGAPMSNSDPCINSHHNNCNDDTSECHIASNSNCGGCGSSTESCKKETPLKVLCCQFNGMNGYYW